MHQASTRLRDRRAQIQRRTARASVIQTERSFVAGQPQFSFSPPETSEFPETSAFPLPPLEIANARAQFNPIFGTQVSPAMGHGRTSTVHMRVQNGPVEVRQRAVTQVPTSPLSPRSPLNPGSPLLAQEECSERIDRLLQRVHRAQQSRREGIVRMEMTSPRTPTRLDPPLVLVQQSAMSSSTVSTASIRSDVSARDTMPEAFSPRRRAATMDPSSEKTPTARERFSFGRTSDCKPSDDMRAKIERVRARRAARLKDELHESPVQSPTDSAFGQLPRMRSEISGTTYYASDDDECDFFEMHDNLMLFREMEVPVKDVDWDKRVYYHHVARTNDAFRKAVEDVEITNCREEYVAELLGRREAAGILRSDAGNFRADQSNFRADQSNFRADQSNFRADQSNVHANEAPHVSRSEGMMAGEFAQPNQAETDAVLEWMDDESDVSSEGHSFDWTQHGFGYMEFRRRSRSSLASSSVLSPSSEHTPRRGLSDLMANDQSRPIESPSARPMDATRSGLEWSVSSSTARAATANFSEAVAAVGVRQALPGLAEVDESDSDDDWHMLDSGDLSRPVTAAEEEAMAQEQLRELRCQNQELRVQVQHMFKAVASLTQVVIGAQ
ncbi:hypothetical protein GGH96_004078 [Coemansia sp. RSA 1972]|nr:hypothetical protein GGH96_004078 [Coemansia sp. RSA 1972]